MRITETFSALNSVRERIDAPLVNWSPIARMNDFETPNAEIRQALRKGIELTLDKVTSRSGLFEHEGEQIVIYIRDNVNTNAGRVTRDVRDDPQHGKRVHLSECSVIMEMKRKGRFDRYVATNRRDNLYTVDVLSRDGRGEESVDLPLLPCINCLKQLNYRTVQFGHEIEMWRDIARKFDLEEFFGLYSTFFSQQPRYRDTDGSLSGYVSGWSTISDRQRNKANWTCSSCRVVLAKPQLRRWLHTHHVNGVRGDNHHTNLVVLCLLCHAEQPGHEHMHVSEEGREAVSQARLNQR